ncbi:LOW QUALITY PROTEIN: complement C4-B [Alosa alosa]|uniref:LOW QUALITY PROTEIN: complement C4-B n=1 Tax=Alosa alosa TaxID=278164 RepID=UPI00201543EE|nr:LOW QUALITY PROTEIN: complement C4-B [Alosa alosa]
MQTEHTSLTTMSSAAFLLFSLLWTAQLVTCHRFLVTSPIVFHIGVKERVSVQLDQTLFNTPVTLYLEHETSGELMSKKEQVVFNSGDEGKTKTAELEVMNRPSRLISANGEPPYLLLVCEIQGNPRKSTRVLVSKHKGYVFIQTDQPIYNPTQKVKYRIFTLDHTMRPHEEVLFVSILNAGGNRIKHFTVKSINGIISKNFDIPDVSEPGIWRISAHYEGDEKKAATREFKVQKFVFPSFVVSIKPERNFYLANSENFFFSIEAKYSYGENVDGAFHSRCGLKVRGEDWSKEEKGGQKEIDVIKGMEQTGTIKNGKAQVVISNFEELLKAKNTSTLQLAEAEAKLYIAVTVTDIKSGELQEAEATLPIVLQPYLVDLSRVNSHFIPGLPFQPAVVVQLPNGSPAPEIQMQIKVSGSQEKQCEIKSNNDGVAYCGFNILPEADSITIKVTVEGAAHEKIVVRASSPSGSFLYLSAVNSVVKMGEPVKFQFKAINAAPADGFFYYLIISKGELRRSGSERATLLTQAQISITHDLVPSFRLVGYFYHSNGEIISNSIWVDVEDVCQGKIVLSHSGQKAEPGRSTKVKIDLGNQKATVALLGVDKAIYGLNSPNKLTPKQVFSSMQSYDLGCSYGGGSDTAMVFNQAGLSFISSGSMASQMRIGFSCESGFRRYKRSLDLQMKMSEREQRYSDKRLQTCCHSGLVQIPMQMSCEERAKRVELRHAKDCVDAFLDCCREGKRLREQKIQEDKRKGIGRTVSVEDIEDFFDNDVQMIRQYFPPSFGFVEMPVDKVKEYLLRMPDSITTWEIQSVSLSQSNGICVAEPLDITVFKDVFLSLRLPYSVKRFEQLSIPVVVYNYGETSREFAVHMKQVDGLCSPAAKTANSYQNIRVENASSLVVTFTAVPMTLGSIPIIIQLYDREHELGVDAIEKMLSVKTEGLLKREEETFYLNLNETSERSLTIPGHFPNSTIPDSGTNVFVKLEGEVFGQGTAVPMLSASKVKDLINAPMGCAEQTMMLMSPTALSLRYLDHSNHWVQLPPGKRDEAIDFIEKGYERILTYKKHDGSYGAWLYYESSTWLTALVVKVLSLVAERQTYVTGEQGKRERVITVEDIQLSVQYLVDVQNPADGSFSDPKPVIHREMQGGIGGVEEEVSLTAFITIAINHSLPFLTEAGKAKAEASISNSTNYLVSRVGDLKRPFALAITTYCLSTCLPDRTLSQSAWERLKSIVTKEGECKVWRANFELDDRGHRYISAEALTVETTAYALMAAVAQNDFSWADDAACFLATREKYSGGWKSTQDTIVALEALSIYAMRRPKSPYTKMAVFFHVPGKSQTEFLAMSGSSLPVEADLKRLAGHSISATVKGEGQAKMKVVKVFHVLDQEMSCDDVSISVTLTGKLDYTEEVVQNYNYEYADYGDERREEEDAPRTAIEWFDARSRRKRDTKQSVNSQENVMYTVCVSYNLERNLTGMAIADITLLSGFEVEVADLDKLKEGTDQYISHYEVSYNRVLLYFNEIHGGRECVSFGAIQVVPIGLIQPAPATFYDYYEPDRKCNTFYSAPKRSKMISKLCSEDVCECAERPCFREKKFSTENEIKKSHRFNHACYNPVVEYGYEVFISSTTQKSNFELYSGIVKSIFRATGDLSVGVGDTRVFAKRMQCKESLEVGKTYLIMGYDGTTKNAHGQMLYLLDSRTWVEQEPNDCRATKKRQYCREFKEFIKEYELDGCTL